MNNLTETVFSRFTSNFSLPKVAFTLAEGATHVALSDKSRKSAFTLDESFTHVAHCDKFRRAAFTLAEVLITLGIIGVVAALTLPTIINKAQSMILKNQFKKAYSTFYNAINLVQKDEPVACWYWDNNNPYKSKPSKCISKNEYGSCIRWGLSDGSSMPSDYSGQFEDCNIFYEKLRKELKTIKYCEDNALKNGCITDNYHGIDKIRYEQNPEKEQDPNQNFSDANIKNKYKAFLTTDNVLYITWNNYRAAPYFTFDINGHKGPNKWGYDLFIFELRGNRTDGITKISPSTPVIVEKGGKSMEQMMRD